MIGRDFLRATLLLTLNSTVVEKSAMPSPFEPTKNPTGKTINECTPDPARALQRKLKKSKRLAKNELV